MISSNKAINGGQLTVQNTRISIWSIMQAISTGLSLKEIALRLNQNKSRSKKFTKNEIGKIIDHYSNQYL